MREMTQQSVSAKLGITQSQYSRLEKGQSDPTRYLNKLSEIFKCEVKELLDTNLLKSQKDENTQSTNADAIGFFFEPSRPHKAFLTLKDGWYDIKVIENLLELILKVKSTTHQTVKPTIKPKIKI